VHEKVYKTTVKDESVEIEFPLETTVQEQIVAREALLNVYTNTEHVVYPVQQHELENEQVLVNQGQFFRNHQDFQPAGTNVNFITGMDKNNVWLQTYERGVENLTLACGTGAIAAALAWHHLQLANSGEYTYHVNVKGGTLLVHFSFDEENKMYKNIKLEGPAVFVFEGQYYV
jgi:diaminopimelate epimerase